MAKASGSDGIQRPDSIALIVWRETPSSSATSPWESPLAVRSSLTAFLTGVKITCHGADVKRSFHLPPDSDRRFVVGIAGKAELMKHIVIAVDGTEASVHAARTAWELFGDGHHYVVVHVGEALPMANVIAVETTAGVPMPPGWNAGPVVLPVAQVESEEYEQDPIELATSIARRVGAEAGLADAEAVGTVGDRAEAILEVAHERRADVVVVGAHEHGWFTRLFGGSVADDVRKHADVPVLIVPVTADADERIIED
jgi:nucleotide-binding universal stress UspA family protein